MAHVVVLGAGVGGLPTAYEIRHQLGSAHTVSLINSADTFQFVPSNPWVLVGWRKPSQVSVPLSRVLARKHIEFVLGIAAKIDADLKSIEMADGRQVPYDYLVIATGAKLAFDEIPGLGPEGLTQSVCTLDHSLTGLAAYQEFLKNPGPVVVGAAQGASCFGPAYETAFIIDADLRKRKLRNRVPMTFVTSEPYIGHLGLGGVGDSKGMIESKLRERNITFITNAKIKQASDGKLEVIEHDADGKELRTHQVPFTFGMVLPAFKGVDAVASVPGLCNPRGFVQVDEHQRSKKYSNIFGLGVSIAIAPPVPTPVPTGVPKTGYMIESMVTATVANIVGEIEGTPADRTATWNAVCLADMGDTGMAFVALPQIPPRNVTWAREGRWVHLAKIGFEKYFLRKMRTGATDPFYEKWAFKTLGIKRLEEKRPV